MAILLPRQQRRWASTGLSQDVKGPGDRVWAVTTLRRLRWLLVSLDKNSCFTLQVPDLQVMVLSTG